MIVKFLAVIMVLSLTACAPATKITPSDVSLQHEMAPSASVVVLGPGDVIDVKFRFLPELDYQQSIRPDGKISLQMVDEVMAAGLTPEGLDNHLTQLYSTKLKSPEITVVVVSLANQNIYVGGEVENPGVLPLTGRLSALQAVVNSGGFKETAEPGSALIIRKGQDNQPVPIPVDLQKILYGSDSSMDILLQPADVVYVPKSSIAKVNKFVRQYIQDLVLFRGFGFTYDLNND
jgi:polysaccharide export outer membrane protein